MKLPTECRARYNAIFDVARELHESFLNGNKSYVLEELKELGSTASFAVVACMVVMGTHEQQADLKAYLLEMA